MRASILRNALWAGSLSLFACATSVDSSPKDETPSSSASALTGAWASYGIPTVSPASIAIGLGAQGLLDVFGIASADGSVVGDAQAVANGGWQAPGSLGGVGFTEIALGHNADGRFQVFGVGGGGLWTIWRTPEGGWSGWTLLGGADLHHLAVTNEADGRLLVVVAGQGNEHLSIIEQNAPNAGWGSFRDIGLASVTQVVAATDTNGVIAIAARAADGEALLAQETGSNSGAFSSLTSLGGWGSKLALAATAGGNVQLYELGSDGSVSTLPRVGYRWQSWSRLGAPGSIDLAVGMAPNGVPIPFVVGPDRRIYQKHAGACGWTLRGDGPFTRVAVANNQDGHLELVGLTTSGTLTHTWETSWTAQTWAGAAPPRCLPGNYGFLTDYSAMSEAEARGRIDEMVDTFGISDVQFYDWFYSYSAPISGTQWTDPYFHRRPIQLQTIEWYVDELHRKGARAWAYVQSVMANDDDDLDSAAGIFPDVGSNRVQLKQGPYPLIFANGPWGNLQAHRWGPTVASLGFDGIHWDQLGQVYYDPAAEASGFRDYLTTAAVVLRGYGLMETFNFVSMNAWNSSLMGVLAFPYSESWSDGDATNYYNAMSTTPGLEANWGVHAYYTTDFATARDRWDWDKAFSLRYLLVGDGAQMLTGGYFPTNQRPLTATEIGELR